MDHGVSNGLKKHKTMTGLGSKNPKIKETRVRLVSLVRNPKAPKTEKKINPSMYYKTDEKFSVGKIFKAIIELSHLEI